MLTILFLILFWLCRRATTSPAYPTTPLDFKDLMSEISWTLKLLLLKDVHPKNPNATDTNPDHIGLEAREIVARTPLQKTNHSKQPIKFRATADDDRPVGLEFLSIRRNQDFAQSKGEDTDMRLKLFKLMYESVRDSDLKAKRAELIRDHYKNSTVFEIGYLMGDITDKFNIMTDISLTLERFHSEWKPIEHINAYEQIANQAIEINHLIEFVWVVNLRDKPRI